MSRGWCPTVHAPMPTGDGLLARVKPFGGRLPAAAIQALAAAAQAFGNGAVELTSRGNLQVRGITDPAAFARATVAAGLADPDPAREARRNVVAVPPCDDTLVAAAEALLAGAPGLPPKFCLWVHGGEVWLGGQVVGLEELAAVVAAGPLTPPSPGGRGLFLPVEGGGSLLYLPFGQTTAQQLGAIRTAVRTTPWRAFLSPVAVPGFPRAASSVTACAGAPACASATVPARVDAAWLQARGARGVHVSGCGKLCGQPRAAVTLVGRAGRYDLCRPGQPTAAGLTLAEAAAQL